MAIVKMQKVKSLVSAVKYCLLDSKTNDSLITSFECRPDNIKNDFQMIQDEYNNFKSKNDEIYSRMIIQSFDNRDILTPEKVHQMGVEFAERYLKNEHQYLVVTHTDSNNLHNHIIFNSVKLDCKTKFNSKTKHTKHDLRKVNDDIALENRLLIPVIEKNKGVSHHEYVVRARNKSFKSRLENAIDDSIKHSLNFDEFINQMKIKGYEIKEGKYLAFKENSQERFIRTKTLGVDYLESSIKFRLENKDFVPNKTNYIDKNWIDKSDEKFKNNFYLKRWASKQNIQYLSEISNKLYKENISLKDVEMNYKVSTAVKEELKNQLETLDSKIYDLERNKNSFQVYKESYSLINDYKNAEDKLQFKSDNYSNFKKYDIARKSIYYLKKEYQIESESDFNSYLNNLKNVRNDLYSTSQLSKERITEKNVEIPRKIENKNKDEIDR